ncbi:UDP-N-acetylmuramoylalanine--D-glutamate ligase [Candidatus Nomurabacteria bacterium RIFCSPHIGHO2_02_FULL_42_19]|uniref:UDP-N-acetylmuramoylalanine--D-glutamate ligase n=1 Tax=Candidatus Nomurabacteria bacterium RIFCSPHIGHO2_02_FULL_42_19 TaxID=1801756 RepID=A0A1F6W306_9BACT|nr:MAG: UDP-N-acetylmuramoylalanine--D-glutamate ligase [Candidatus Nomurabacteria bacterium RIFCSPHIGHO2_02_FULL_42_19]
MRDFRAFFKGKSVTVVGLGLLGKRLGDIAFLAQCGAKVLVTDLKSARELTPSIKKLQKYNKPARGRAGIQYVLGKHRMQDFENCDFVLKGQGVALDSPYILHAREKGIPIEMDESLFVKLAPQVKIIGVTGTRGKSTTTVLIYEILKRAGMRVHLGGNIRGTAALSLLKEVKKGDTVVLELSSWQLQGFNEAKISPNISVFTNLMSDHWNYYKNNRKQYFIDKSYIYKFQKKDDILILGPSMKGKIKNVKSKIINANIKNVPKLVNLPGQHNLENIACAVEVAKILKIPDNIIKKTVENFKALQGRLKLVRNIRGVKIYNDTNSTTPEATTAALNSFKHKIVLIMGGMDKGPEVNDLNKILSNKTKKIFLTPGSGSEKIENTKANIVKVANLKDAINKSIKVAKKGDIILFSPGFASFNMFNNEYDRGDKFMKLVKKLK